LLVFFLLKKGGGGGIFDVLLKLYVTILKTLSDCLETQKKLFSR
jgi:hypothetical protein